jgi:hypothetical protein
VSATLIGINLNHSDLCDELSFAIHLFRTTILNSDH